MYAAPMKIIVFIVWPLAFAPFNQEPKVKHIITASAIFFSARIPLGHNVTTSEVRIQIVDQNPKAGFDLGSEG